MIFYYAHNADIFIVRIVSGYGNLDTLFSEDSNVKEIILMIAKD